MKSALNNLFGGKNVESDLEDNDRSGDENNKNDEEEAYMAKLSRQERKKFKKNKQKDKIGTKDAKVLTGGMTVADNAKMSRLTQKLEASKPIKKGGKKGVSPHEITREMVQHKLQTKRLAIPLRRLNK